MLNAKCIFQVVHLADFDKGFPLAVALQHTYNMTTTAGPPPGSVHPHHMMQQMDKDITYLSKKMAVSERGIAFSSTSS